jgi:hypothetical protein
MLSYVPWTSLPKEKLVQCKFKVIQIEKSQFDIWIQNLCVVYVFLTDW